jgi:hypothetical protein
MTPGVDVTGGVCRNDAGGGRNGGVCRNDAGEVDVTGGVCRNDAGVDVTGGVCRDDGGSVPRGMIPRRIRVACLHHDPLVCQCGDWRSQGRPAFLSVIPASPHVIPASPHVIPASPHVIPASPPVIPAKAGILIRLWTFWLTYRPDPHQRLQDI